MREAVGDQCGRRQNISSVVFLSRGRPVELGRRRRARPVDFVPWPSRGNRVIFVPWERWLCSSRIARLAKIVQAFGGKRVAISS